MKRISTLFLFILLFGSTLFSQEVAWEKTLGGNKSEYLHDVKPTPDFGFILAGSSLSDATGNKAGKIRGDLDYFIWKMDENGNQEWQKSFGGSGTDYLYCVNLTQEGGYILGGSSNSPKSGDKTDENLGLDDFWVIKLNPKGEQEWQFTLGGEGTDVLLSIQQTQDKGYILGGTSDSPKGKNLKENPYQKSESSRGSVDYWVIKISEKGNIEWQRTIGGKHYDFLKKIEQTPDGGYILGGHSNSMASGEKQEDSKGLGDYWVVKLDKDGNQEWQKTIGGDKEDELFTMLTNEKGYLLGGNSNSGMSKEKREDNQQGIDWWLVQLDNNGEILWQKTYDISQNDIFVDITKTDDNNYLLSGFAKGDYSNGKEKKGIEDYVVIKIDEKGEQLWRKSMGGKSSDRLQKTIKSRDGGYVLAGTSTSGAGGNKRARSLGREDYWIVKLLDPDVKEKVIVQQLELYPNPAKDFINVLVHEDFEEAELQIFDMLGALVLEQALEHKITPVNIQQLQTGAYVAKISTNNNTFNAKFLKK